MTTFLGNPVTFTGKQLQVGDKALDFSLTTTDLLTTLSFLLFLWTYHLPKDAGVGLKALTMPSCFQTILTILSGAIMPS